MKKWIKAVVFSLALIFVIPVTVSQCDQTVVQAAQKTQKVKISKSKMTIKEGDKTYLSLIIDGSQLIDNGYAIKWSSSDKNVVTVNKFGRIKGISKGTATISAKFEKKTYKCKVTVKQKFNKEEAKSKIEITPIGTDNTLYKVTSIYDIPTYVTANYKIVDKDGVTISKSSTSVLATSWGDSYIKIPPIKNDQTVQLSYLYSDSSSVSKDKYNNLLNSIQICKFEDVTGSSFVGYENAGWFIYDVYIKNTSNKKIEGSIGFLIYDDKGEMLPYQANSQVNINLDPDETVKEGIAVLQEIKNKEHAFEDLTKVGDIKFYIAGL